MMTDRDIASHPELPDTSRFAAALLEFTVQQVEAAVREWAKS